MRKRKRPTKKKSCERCCNGIDCKTLPCEAGCSSNQCIQCQAQAKKPPSRGLRVILPGDKKEKLQRDQLKKVLTQYLADIKVADGFLKKIKEEGGPIKWPPGEQKYELDSKSVNEFKNGAKKLLKQAAGETMYTRRVPTWDDLKQLNEDDQTEALKSAYNHWWNDLELSDADKTESVRNTYKRFDDRFGKT